MKAAFAVLAALWCEWTHGGGWVMRDPAGRVNWQCQKCGRWAEPVSESDEANLLKRHMEQRQTCQKCGGSGIESHRVHGIWPNGEECVEPIKCAACAGFGAAQ